MARYISLHTLGCLTRQGAEELTRKLEAATGFVTRRVLCNLVEGTLLAEFEAPNREVVEAWLAGQDFHYQWLLRIEYESSGGPLLPA